MDTSSLRAGLERFASDLRIAGEPTTFDVVVGRHLSLFLEASKAGLTAPRIAKLLAQTGARRANGAAITADQVRASVSRAKRRQAPAPEARHPNEGRHVAIAEQTRPATADEPPRHGEPVPAATAPSRSLSPPRSSPSAAAQADPDVSDAEIRAARDRLHRL